MMDRVLELMTGTGLATSAGLNAYIPLLAVGLLDRHTGLITLPPGWEWLSNGWVLAILFVLLVVEFAADKVPLVDSINDVLQTVVRPTAGGLAFGAGASSKTPTVTGSLFSDSQWTLVAAGVVIALFVHILKAVARPVINAATAGFGGPVASTAEDTASVAMSLAAIVMPFLTIFFVAGLAGFFWWALRRRARRRARARQPAVDGLA